MTVRTEDSNFNRDEYTSALINTNAEAYKAYRTQRIQLNESANMQRQIDMLKTDMNDIKNMLKVLIQRENNGTSND